MTTGRCLNATKFFILLPEYLGVVFHILNPFIMYDSSKVEIIRRILIVFNTVIYVFLL